jgi:hypothetical protein
MVLFLHYTGGFLRKIGCWFEDEQYERIHRQKLLSSPTSLPTAVAFHRQMLLLLLLLPMFRVLLLPMFRVLLLQAQVQGSDNVQRARCAGKHGRCAYR